MLSNFQSRPKYVLRRMEYLNWKKICNLMKVLDYLQINDLQQFLRTDVNSDFISKREKRLTFPNYFWNRIPKVCSLIRKTFFMLFVCGFGKQGHLKGLL